MTGTTSTIKVESRSINLSTRGNTDVVDITGEVISILDSSSVKNGTATLFVVGSTAALSTIEYEPGLVKDIDIALEKLAPRDGHYEHHLTWGDDNGNSHIRATMMGPSLTVPITRGKMPLGTWQQIVLIDFDTRPRSREIVVQLMGN
tara:strand:- start:10 stop:450 length:441 start_codon:yes stop_codon:yes gene_type:complete